MTNKQNYMGHGYVIKMYVCACESEFLILVALVVWITFVFLIGYHLVWVCVIFDMTFEIA